jgi:cytochrome P450
MTELQQFDHHTSEFARNWRAQYSLLRSACPVARSAAHGGFTVLTRYEDVKHALLTPADFACSRELLIAGLAAPIDGGVTIPTNPFRMGMMEMDPPESTKLRKLLIPWFSARAVDANAGHIRDLVTWCLDRVIDRGRMDVVDDLANPLPALVTLDLMGLPLENWERYAQILHEAAYRASGSARQVAWLLEDLRTIVEGRRERPATIPTPLDAMLAAEIDGRALPVELVVELVFMLLNGGIDTSTALIAHSIRHLSAHPGLMARLSADPSLIPVAVEEFLRYFTPGTGLARTAVRDTFVGGTEIRAGERIFLALGSANTDPDAFARADTVDISRDGNRHLAFGAGVHRCLGSFLAPREISILFEELLSRMPDLRVEEAGVEAYPSIPLVAGFKTMPASFTPGLRRGRLGVEAAPPARSERDLARLAKLAAEGDDLPV